MQKITIGIAALCFMPIAATCIFLLHSTAVDAPQPSTKPDSSVAAAPPSPAPGRRLAANDAALRRLAARVAAQPPVEEALPVHGTTEDPLDSPTEAINPEVYNAMAVALLESTAQEGTSDAWAKSKESELMTKFGELSAASDSLGVELRAVTCKSQLCRVQVAPAPNTDPQQLAQFLSAKIEWAGERLVKVVPGEHPEATLYLGREGTNLPRVALADLPNPTE